MKGIKNLSTAVKVLSIIALVVVCIALVFSVVLTILSTTVPENLVKWNSTTSMNISVDWDSVNVPAGLKSALTEAIGDAKNFVASTASGNLTTAEWVMVQISVSMVCVIVVFAFIIKVCKGICEDATTIYSEKARKGLVGLGIALLVNRFVPAIFSSIISVIVTTYTEYTLGIRFADIILTCVYIAAYLFYCYLEKLEPKEEETDSAEAEVFPIEDTTAPEIQ